MAIKKSGVFVSLLFAVLSWQAGLASDRLSPQLERSITRASHLSDGKLGRLWVVFYDARCPVCLALYQHTRTAVKHGQLQIHWVPVAILGPPASHTPDTVMANTALLRLLSPRHAPLTPTLVYWDTNGQAQLHQGLPSFEGRLGSDLDPPLP